MKVESKWICHDTGRYLLDHEIKTFAEYAGKRVMMSRGDMNEIKNFADPGLLTILYWGVSITSFYLFI